ncbi:Elongator complex protein 4 [Smittium mucronatum]|uniref:Elongator complex protein 4 n=1 Tax=Smittium mucronatum TaxID=133383 RepID=A0A1R0GYA9_9FUNG|nr:Elongator complex protein 4 [Smittium mucronatum]
MSFKKIGSIGGQIGLPSGTKLVGSNSLVLVSSGISSLDDVLGGGLAVGTILLVEEDRMTGYSQILQSIFEAQSVCSNHKLFVAKTGLETKKDLVLPKRIDKQTPVSAEKSADMKIAWRYNKSNPVAVDLNVKTSGSEQDTYCHEFDLSASMNEGEIENADVDIVNVYDMVKNNTVSGYSQLFSKISQFVENGYSSLDSSKQSGPRRIARISLHSIGSAIWQQASDKEILEFFVGLKGLLRYSYAACMISIPSEAQGEKRKKSGLLRRIEKHCDSVVELESFEGGYVEGSRLLKLQKTKTKSNEEYHGLFHIHKLPCLNSLVPPASKLSILARSGGGSTNNLAFRLRRKKFSIETYHLPIEGGSSERRVPESQSATKLDF